MVEVHGRTLLDRSLEALVDHEVDRIVIVVGYHAQGVREAVGDDYRGTPVTYVENVDYATTNNIHSLYLAADELAKDDTLLLESDLDLRAARSSSDCSQHPAPNVVAVDGLPALDGRNDGHPRSRPRDRGVRPQAHLVDGQAMDQYFKTVNIYKLSQDFIENRYLPFLEAYVRSVGANEYYEQVLRVIAGLDNHGLVGMPVEGERWYEIDDMQDYQIAETMFAPDDERYDRYLSRHGGYWRFPHLLDFCYLVNPWFPTMAMRDELRRSFDTLLSDYPSARPCRDHLAAKMFDGDPDVLRRRQRCGRADHRHGRGARRRPGRRDRADVRGVPEALPERRGDHGTRGRARLRHRVRPLRPAVAAGRRAGAGEPGQPDRPVPHVRGGPGPAGARRVRRQAGHPRRVLRGLRRPGTLREPAPPGRPGRAIRRRSSSRASARATASPGPGSASWPPATPTSWPGSPGGSRSGTSTRSASTSCRSSGASRPSTPPAARSSGPSVTASPSSSPPSAACGSSRPRRTTCSARSAVA